MTKVSLELDQVLNQRLKAHCAKRYPDSYGHQQEVIREALTAFLDAQEKPKAAPKVYGMPHDGESTAKEKPIAKTLPTKAKPIDDPAMVEIMQQMLKEGRKVKEINEKTLIPPSTIRSRIKSMKKKGELA